MNARGSFVGIGLTAVLAALSMPTDGRAQSCYDGICASPIVCNECGDWEDDHSNHTAPPETTHNFESAAYYPYRPGGGAAVGGSYHVTVYWRSYHRAMPKGDDKGHCSEFCAQKDVPYNQCFSFWGLDGLGLLPEKVVRKGGPYALSIRNGWIQGPYQSPPSNQGKWEWPETTPQSGITGSCAWWYSGRDHDWTSRPTDVLEATFFVGNWNGSSWANPDYELFWDEDDGIGNDDLDFRVTPSQPGVVSLGRAVETCLDYGSQGQRFTLHRDAVLMLCENRNLTDRCDDHLFEIWFDVQCRWVRPPLSVSVSGPYWLALHESGQFTANPGNGQAPYTYRWRTRIGNAYSWGSWSSWYGTGSSNVTYASLHSCDYDRLQVEAEVTDSAAAKATSSSIAYISDPCGSPGPE
jgi:hypothetical protein